MIGHTTVGGQPPVRETTGDLDQVAFPAGQGVGLVTAVRPAAEVVAELTTQALAALAAHRP